MSNSDKKVLYIDMSHPFENVRARGQTDWFETRDSLGFFKKIWSVHPIADVGGGTSRKLEIFTFSPDHQIIEGVSRSRPHWPRLLAPLDFFLSQLELVRVLMRIIRKERVSLIIATDPLYGGLLGLLLKHLCRVPLVVAVYGNFELAYRASGTLIMPRLFPFYWLQSLAARLAFRGADLAIANSRDNIDYAIRAGARPDRTAVIPVAKIVQHWHFRNPTSRWELGPVLERFGIPPARQYLILISRLLPIKFAEDGVRAMKVAVEAAPGTVGILAGDGPLRSELEALVSSWGLEERIIFAGNVDQEALSILLPHCITLSPLTGMALIESGLGGSPVVAYDYEWQREFISDGETGFLVPHRDHQAMGAKALELIHNDALREEFARRIRERTLVFADRERVARLEQTEFGKVIEEHEAGHRRGKSGGGRPEAPA